MADQTDVGMAKEDHGQMTSTGFQVNHVFILYTFVTDQGPVVRKPINANPGFKVNQTFNFSCIKFFFSANVLETLRLVKVKTEGQKI